MMIKINLINFYDFYFLWTHRKIVNKNAVDPQEIPSSHRKTNGKKWKNF